jgi:hypothetical protein
MALHDLPTDVIISDHDVYTYAIPTFRFGYRYPRKRRRISLYWPFAGFEDTGRLGYLRDFGQFVIDTSKRTPSISMSSVSLGQKNSCPPGFRRQCVAGLPCQDGYEHHCTRGTGFPCICVR